MFSSSGERRDSAIFRWTTVNLDAGLRRQDEHAEMVEHYRAAHQIAVRNQGGNVTTEDLRKAIVHYRAIFDELLEVGRPRERAQEEKKGGFAQWKFGKDLFRRQI